MNFKDIQKTIGLLEKSLCRMDLKLEIFSDGSGSLQDYSCNEELFAFGDEEDFYKEALEILEKDNLDPEKRLLAIVNKE